MSDVQSGVHDQHWGVFVSSNQENDLWREIRDFRADNLDSYSNRIEAVKLSGTGNDIENGYVYYFTDEGTAAMFKLMFG